MSRIKRILFSLVATLGLMGPALVPATVYAQADIGNSLNEGACLEVGNPDCDIGSNDPKASVNNVIAQVINIFSLIVGVVSVIMIIFGGFKYITSGGDSGNVTTAKNTILYAVIGLVIVALAQIIVRYVLNFTDDAVNAT